MKKLKEKAEKAKKVAQEKTSGMKVNVPAQLKGRSKAASKVPTWGEIPTTTSGTVHKILEQGKAVYMVLEETQLRFVNYYPNYGPKDRDLVTKIFY